ncbi:MlaD family protein [Allocoleopsis franciscana]|uniref:ABC-type transport system involved in resistance to organic solvents, periplasmic component n=1 Tax=Allocoleopsis franciscana PCC 7113 TaxID=1173027 RepID=K9W8T4_9CYAN|nr:MlaD family protein [Allocoleopsis franciscana]AFZ16216.1 ABC-type transport system involved in resistance to organic solvents, periplasmic component [Allocoleopsis franciscana PCC 7113]
MRSRTVREGSVGLLILVGLAVFVGLVIWIRGQTFGARSYQFIVKFANVAGMKTGAMVRYRGVKVGRITEVTPETNGVNATVEISDPDLLIPKDVVIEANQAGLVGETSIDITPQKPLPAKAESIDPLSRQCNSTLVICNNDRLAGRIGVSFEELLRYTIRLAEVYTDPKFFGNVETLTQNAAVAATSVTQLTNELTLLSRSARQELGSFSTATNTLSRTANQTMAQVGVAANRFGNTADSLSNTANQYSLTAGELTKLVATANNLVATNRASLVGTLDSVRQTSDQLRGLVASFTPISTQLSSAAGKLNTTAGQINVGGLLKNLETLSANAATASANLRDISTSLNNPNNVVLLQQTLDSARATFENAQKITSDLDDLTGDPAFRENLKQLVNGLGKLVSSTEQLQQQVQVAQTIEPVSTAINATADSATSKAVKNGQPQPNVELPDPTKQLNSQKDLPPLFPPAPKKLPVPQATSQPLAEIKGESPPN